MKNVFFAVAVVFGALFSSMSMATQVRPETVAGPYTNQPVAEIAAINQAIDLLERNQLDQAYITFLAAVEKFGSPLGYFYAGLLHSDDANAQRYINIAYTVLPKDCINSHFNYIESLIIAS